MHSCMQFKYGPFARVFSTAESVSLLKLNTPISQHRQRCRRFFDILAVYTHSRILLLHEIVPATTQYTPCDQRRQCHHSKANIC